MTALGLSPRVNRAATRLLMVFLVITLSFAILPLPAAAKGVAAPVQALKAAKLAAKIVGRNVKIVGTGFAPKSKYDVRVREGYADPWAWIGRIKANKNGKFDAVLQLPAELATANALQVCVKDIQTGKERCTIATRK